MCHDFEFDTNYSVKGGERGRHSFPSTVHKLQQILKVNFRSPAYETTASPVDL